VTEPPPFKRGPLPATALDGKRDPDRDHSGFAAHAKWFRRVLLGLPE